LPIGSIIIIAIKVNKILEAILLTDKRITTHIPMNTTAATFNEKMTFVFILASLHHQDKISRNRIVCKSSHPGAAVRAGVDSALGQGILGARKMAQNPTRLVHALLGIFVLRQIRRLKKILPQKLRVVTQKCSYIFEMRF
jgi:hypothetical protein